MPIMASRHDAELRARRSVLPRRLAVPLLEVPRLLRRVALGVVVLVRMHFRRLHDLVELVLGETEVAEQHVERRWAFALLRDEREGRVRLHPAVPDVERGDLR